MKPPFVKNFSIRIKYSLPTMHFFTPEGRVTHHLPLRGEIFESLKHYAINNVPRKVTNILEVMKLAAYIEDFSPEANKIHLANGTIYIEGTFIPEKPDIVRMRLPVNYNPDTPEASTWLSFLDQPALPGRYSNFTGIHRVLPDSKQQGTTDDDYKRKWRRG